MTRKQGVIFRLMIVLAIMVVFGGATFVIVKKFFIQSSWDKIIEAKALLAEAIELEEADDWMIAQAKLTKATKLAEDVANQKSPYALEMLGDIQCVYAKHYRKKRTTHDQVSNYVKNALERYKSAQDLYPKEDHQKLGPALKRCKLLHTYTAMKAFGMIRDISDKVLRSVKRSEEEYWKACWAGLVYYNAWSTEEYGRGILIRARDEIAGTGGIIKKEIYEEVMAEYEKARQGYLEIIEMDFDPDQVKDELPDLFKLYEGDVYMMAGQVELRISDVAFQSAYGENPRQAAEEHNEKAKEYFQKALELAAQDRVETYLISAMKMKSQFGRTYRENDYVESNKLGEYLFPGLGDLTEAVLASDKSWSNAVYIVIADANKVIAGDARARANKARQDGHKAYGEALVDEAEIREQAAVDIFSKGRERLGNDIRLLRDYIKLLINIKRMSEARSELVKAMEDISNPEYNIKARQLLVQLLFREASEAESDKIKDAKIAEVKKNLEILIKADVDNIETNLARGQFHVMQKEYDRAEEYYKLILRDSARAVDGYSALGKLYSVWDKPLLAEQAYHMAAKGTGYVSPRECSNLITFYLNKNQITRAEAVIALHRRSVIAAQQNPNPYILFLQSQIDVQSGRHKDAQNILRNLTEDNQRSGYDYYYALSVVRDPLAGIKDLQVAQKLLGKMWLSEVTREGNAVEKYNVEFLCQHARCWVRLCALETSTQQDKDHFDKIVSEMKAFRVALMRRSASDPDKYGEATVPGIKTISNTIYNIYSISQMKKEPEASGEIVDAALSLMNLDKENIIYQNLDKDAMLFGRPQNVIDRLKAEFFLGKIGLAENALEASIKRLEEAKEQGGEDGTPKAQEEKENAVATLWFWRRHYISLLERTGQQELASKQLKLAYDENKSNFDIINRLARYYLSLNTEDMESAKIYIDKMVEIDPVRASAVTLRANYDARIEKDITKRIKLLENVLAKNPLPEIYINLGEVCLNAAKTTGDLLMYKNAAIDAYEKARKLLPGNISVLDKLAYTRFEVARIHKSNHTSAKFDELYIKPAKSNVKTILSIDPDNFRAGLLMALLAQFADSPDTMSMFEDLAEQLTVRLGEHRKAGNEEEAQRDERNLYNTYMALSDVCRNNKEFETAEKYVGKAKQYGSELDADLKLINLKLTKKEYKQAVVDMEELIADEANTKNREDDIKIRNAYIQTLFASMTGLQNKILQEQPDLKRGDELRAEIRAYREKFESFNEKSIKKYPNLFEFRYNQIRYFNSIALRPEWAYLRADELRKEILDNPDFINREIALATLAGYYANKDGDENLMIAETLYLEALKAQPNNEGFNKALVLGLYVPHQRVFPDKALEFVDDHIVKNPDRAMFVILRAMTLFNLKRYYNAVGAWDAAREKFPDNPNVYLGYIQSVFKYETKDLKQTRARLIEILVDKEAELESILLSNALGQIYYDDDQADRATGCFDRVLKIDPENERAMFYKAVIAYDKISKDNKSSNLDELRIVEKHARRTMQNYLDLYEKIASANSLANAYGLMAGCEAYAGNSREAIEYLKKAAAKNLDASAIKELRRIYLTYDWPQLTAEESKEYTANNFYKWLFNIQGRDKDKNYQTQLSLGCAAMVAEMNTAGDYLLNAERIAKLNNPKSVEPYVFLDINELTEGNHTLAEKYFATVREKVAGEYWQVLATVDNYIAYGHKDRAVRLLEYLIPLAKKNNDTSGEAAIFLARLAKMRLMEADTPDVEAARKLIAEALQLDPKNQEATWIQGWIKVLDAATQTDAAKKQAAIKAGIEEIEKVVNAKPSHLAWAYLARAYHALAVLETDDAIAKKTYADARRAITQALGLHPVYEDAEEMKALYKQIKDK